MPEGLDRLIQRRATGDESDEAPAEAPVQIAEHPPANEEVLAVGGLESAAELVELALRSVAALDAVLQCLQLPRHCCCHADPFPAQRYADLSGIKGAGEDDFASKQLRNENAHHLAEDMAEGQEAEKPHGMEKTCQPPVLFNLAFERVEICEQIAVCQADTFRLRRRPRSKDDLDKIIFPDLRLVSASGVMLHAFKQRIEPQSRDGEAQTRLLFAAAEQQFRTNLLLDARRKIGRILLVQRNGNHAPQQAAEESCNPCTSVLPPQQDTISLSYAARLVFAGYLKSGLGKLRVRPAQGAQAIALDERGLAPASKRIANEAAECFAHVPGVPPSLKTVHRPSVRAKRVADKARWRCG